EEFHIRESAVESLFGYDPRWFPPAVVNPPRPPPWHEAKTETLEQLLKIGDHCLTLEVSDRAKGYVQSGKKEIQRVLDFRRAGGPEHVMKLIRDLDDSKYSVRETASLALEKYGDLAEAALRKALEQQPGMEVHQRIERILAKINKAEKK